MFFFNEHRTSTKMDMDDWEAPGSWLGLVDLVEAPEHSYTARMPPECISGMPQSSQTTGMAPGIVVGMSGWPAAHVHFCTHILKIILITRSGPGGRGASPYWSFVFFNEYYFQYMSTKMDMGSWRSADSQDDAWRHLRHFRRLWHTPDALRKHSCRVTVLWSFPEVHEFQQTARCLVTLVHFCTHSILIKKTKLY